MLIRKEAKYVSLFQPGVTSMPDDGNNFTLHYVIIVTSGIAYEAPDIHLPCLFSLSVKNPGCFGNNAFHPRVL